MARQPRYSVSIPPITGERAGPSMIPDCAAPIYLPRSAVIHMLVITPLFSEYMPELPTLCKQRRI